MIARLVLKEGRIQEFDVDTATAPTKHFPQWAFWKPVNEDGNQEVMFFNADNVQLVSLIGPGEKDDEPSMGKLIVFPGGEED